MLFSIDKNRIAMAKKSKKNRKGIVFSTNPDYDYNYAEEEDKRMTANMGGAVHLNSGGMSIDQMARRKLQEDLHP